MQKQPLAKKEGQTKSGKPWYDDSVDQLAIWETRARKGARRKVAPCQREYATRPHIARVIVAIMKNGLVTGPCLYQARADSSRLHAVSMSLNSRGMSHVVRSH